MSSKLLKKLTFGTLLLQVIASAVLVLGMNGAVFAQDKPDPMLTAPQKGTPSNQQSTVGDEPKISGGSATSDTKRAPAMSPASMHFNLSNLKADGQEQSYLKSGNPIGSFIIQVVNFLVLTIGSVCFIALVIGGFVLLTSHGNENSVTKGKEIITNALIGLVVVLRAYFITAFVQSLFYDLPNAAK